MNTSSFSYEKFFHGHSVMFIVPHEDDEINMAGATIYGAIQEGLEVYVVFITNGDYEYTFDVRRNEAYQMAKEIGLPRENRLLSLVVLIIIKPMVLILLVLL